MVVTSCPVFIKIPDHSTHLEAMQKFRICNSKLSANSRKTRISLYYVPLENPFNLIAGMAFSDQPLQTRLPRTGAGLSAVVLAE
jgi:hypothetical protein